jgi:hypothetical protein
LKLGRNAPPDKFRSRPQTGLHARHPTFLRGKFLIMKTLLCVFAALLAITSLRADWTATAPGGQVTLTVSLDATGTPHYRVTHHGKPVVLASRLGFEAAEKTKHLLDGFEFVGTAERRADTARGNPSTANAPSFPTAITNAPSSSATAPPARVSI